MADIIIAGILVADIIKLISHYPQKGMLADISKVTYGIGGCAANTAVSVKKLDSSINVKSVALVGKDEQGTFVKKKLSEYGIDISMIQETDCEVTGFTDVMTIESTGERTFFLNRGANKIFDESNLQIEEEEGSIILLGYGGILDALNKPNEKYGTDLARAFHDLKEKGLITAMDVASMKDKEEMQRLVIPSLKYVDYLIVNEIEAGEITEIEIRKADGMLDRDAMNKAASKIMSMGVQKCCVLHAPEYGCALDNEGNYTGQPSLNLPDGYIAGTVGAGDSFCAGILYAVYKKLSMNEALKIAVATAAANLSAEDSIGGLRNIEETMKLYDTYSPEK